MKMRFVMAVLACGFGAAVASAANKTPTAVDLLFNAQHLTTVKKGEELNYRFKRDVSNSKSAASQSFEDDILIEITNETPEKAKNLKLKVFSGDRARDPFETPGMTGNPLLIWCLNRFVASYNKLAGGNAMYLKGKIRDALGDEAKVEPTKLDINGSSVDGHKVMVVPFVDDPAKSRMNGFEKSTLEIVVSDKVPGYIHAYKATFFSSGKRTPRIIESVEYTGVGEPK